MVEYEYLREPMAYARVSPYKSIAVEAPVMARRHDGHPVASVGAARDVVREAGQIESEWLHKALLRALDVQSESRN